VQRRNWWAYSNDRRAGVVGELNGLNGKCGWGGMWPRCSGGSGMDIYVLTSGDVPKTERNVFFQSSSTVID
jgi:hypothetical protein